MLYFEDTYRYLTCVSGRDECKLTWCMSCTTLRKRRCMHVCIGLLEHLWSRNDTNLNGRSLYLPPLRLWFELQNLKEMFVCWCIRAYNLGLSASLRLQARLETPKQMRICLHFWSYAQDCKTISHYKNDSLVSLDWPWAYG